MRYLPTLPHRRALLACLATLGVCWSARTLAATGLAEITQSAQGPVTVFYPTTAAEQPVRRGPFELNLAPDAPPLRGNGRLIVLSHGSGGAPWVHSDFARHLVAAGYIVAMPQHAGDNWQDMGQVGPPSFALRPHEVSAAIDAVQNDPRFATLADFSQVGVWGMSAGGHTALTLAGGRWSAARLRDHCETHIGEDFMACTGANIELKGGAFDGIKKALALAVIRFKLSDGQMHGHTDARIKAIVAGVPFASDFDLATLAAPVAPLGLVQAQQDIWLLPKFNSAAVLAACKPCELVADLPSGGHGALMSPLPVDMPGWLARLLDDPPGFERNQETPPLHARTTAFFQKHLLKTSP